MAQLVFLFLYLLLGSAFAQKLSFVAETSFEYLEKFNKTKIGGLSGIHYSETDNLLYAVSDDRGQNGEPRIYHFSLNWEKEKLTIKPVQVSFIHHRGEKGRPKEILDLEAITPLPWGSFLVTSEGDFNKKPRQMPRLMDVKADGSWVRDYDVPKVFLPELVGQQKNGIRNNNGFEGAAVSPSGKKWLVATESDLVNETMPGKKWIRFLEYTMPEAWVLSPGRQFIYEISHDSIKDGLVFENGVSEILFLDEVTLLVLERGLKVNAGEASYDVKIFIADLKNATDVSKVSKLSAEKDLIPIKKTLVLNSKDLLSSLKKTKKIENYEGMTWIPSPNKGEKYLLLVSDDNFMRSHTSHFLVLKLNK